jgi:hypothetical protein
VAVLGPSKAQMSVGYRIVWISPRIKDEQPGEKSFFGGRLRVIKIKFNDGASIPSLYGTSRESQNARHLFGDAFVDVIRTRFRPEDCFVHLMDSSKWLAAPANCAELTMT